MCSELACIGGVRSTDCSVLRIQNTDDFVGVLFCPTLLPYVIKITPPIETTPEQRNRQLKLELGTRRSDSNCAQFDCPHQPTTPDRRHGPASKQRSPDDHSTRFRTLNRRSPSAQEHSKEGREENNRPPCRRICRPLAAMKPSSTRWVCFRIYLGLDGAAYEVVDRTARNGCEVLSLDAPPRG